MKYCEIIQVLQNVDSKGIGISSMIGNCITRTVQTAAMAAPMLPGGVTTAPILANAAKDEK
jgi:hypothetical protein